MNAYIGLENFISWANCGIAKGNLIYSKDIDKQKVSDKEKAKLESTVFTAPDGKEYAFVQNDKARKWISKTLGESIDVQQLFSTTGFPNEVLTQLDDIAIKPAFNYGVGENITEELESIIESNDEDDAE